MMQLVIDEFLYLEQQDTAYPTQMYNILLDCDSFGSYHVQGWA